MLVVLLHIYNSIDISAAFDTIDHSILLNHLKHWFGVLWTILNLLSSFLSGRSHVVVTSNVKSQPNLLEYDIPQSNVLESLLYSLYTTPLLSVISNHPGIQCHFYEEDRPTQFYLKCSPERTSSAFSTNESCITDVCSWTTSNKSSVNPNKTDYL